MSVSGWLLPLSNRLHDVLARQLERPAQDRVVVVEIDDAALDLLGGWPLSREVYAQWLDLLAPAAHQPRAVALDLLFLDATAQDERLARSLAAHRAVLPLESLSAQGAVLERPPVAPLRRVARLAHIEIELEGDGFARGLQAQVGGRPHLALALAGVAQPPEPGAVVGYRRFAVGTPGLDFQRVSLADVMSVGFPLQMFRDKHVLLGVTSTSLGDRYPVNHPAHAVMPGVYLIASATQAALAQQLISVAHPLTAFAANGAALVLPLLCLLWLRPLACALTVLGFCLLATALAGLWLWQADVWLSPLPSMLTALLVYGVWGWRRINAMGKLVRRKSRELSQAAGAAAAPAARSPQRGPQEVVLRHADMLEQAVEAASLELNYLTTVIDRMPAAVGVYHADGQLVAGNPAWIEAVGQPAGAAPALLAQVLGRWGLQPVLPADMPDTPLKHLVQLESPRGRRHLYLDRSSVDVPVRGRLDILTLTDITYLKAYQDQREMALQFLSHDMRTPLASIIALTRSGQGMATEVGQRIAQQAQSLLDLMHDFLLTLSAGEPRYELAEELLSNLTYSAIDQVTALAQARQVSIVEEGLADVALVKVKAQLLVRALVNLLVNAIKYSPVGATIRVESRRHPQGLPVVELRIHNPRALTPAPLDLPSNGLGTQFVETVLDRHGGRLETHFDDPHQAWVCVRLPCEFLEL